MTGSAAARLRTRTVTDLLSCRSNYPRPEECAGFTLIEVLVVVAIIGLLASIILFSVSAARNKAIYTKGLIDLRQLSTALELYTQDHGDWAPAGGTLYADTAPGGGWDQLDTLLKPYLPSAAFPGFPTISPKPGFINQGFVYMKGTDTNVGVLKTFNSLTGAFVACIFIRYGYYVDFVLPEQSSLTLNDGGIDPDGIEEMQGDYTIYTDPSQCP